MLIPIIAACCQHVIRHSPCLLQDWQDEVFNIDTNIPYYMACEHAIHHELKRSQQAYDRSCKLGNTTEAESAGRTRTLKEYNAARTTFVNSELYMEKVRDGSSSKVVEAEKTSTWVRSDEQQQHRPETLVRERDEFDRTSTDYRPGRYADQTGDGFLDTSFANMIAKWENRLDR